MDRLAAWISRAFVALVVAMAIAPAANAAAPASKPAGKPTQKPAEKIVYAHPALWTVHGPQATVYLLGSIHVLPKNVQWRTPAIDAAFNSADVFVFEIPMNEAQQKAQITDFIRQNGLLPPGMALPSLLTADIRKDYTQALAMTHVQPELLTPMRPWLAALTLESGINNNEHMSTDAGVDRTVYGLAQKKTGVTFRAFETPEQQLKLLMPEDQSLEVQEFDANLKEMLSERAQVHELLSYWEHGDVQKLNALMHTGFHNDPRAEKALFENRNRAWIVQLKKMLAENHTFFVTVGAGHLAGPKGVPALLRHEGYKVDGP